MHAGMRHIRPRGLQVSNNVTHKHMESQCWVLSTGSVIPSDFAITLYYAIEEVVATKLYYKIWLLPAVAG